MGVLFGDSLFGISWALPEAAGGAPGHPPSLNTHVGEGPGHETRHRAVVRLCQCFVCDKGDQTPDYAVDQNSRARWTRGGVVPLSWGDPSPRIARGAVRRPGGAHTNTHHNPMAMPLNQMSSPTSDPPRWPCVSTRPDRERRGWVSPSSATITSW